MGCFSDNLVPFAIPPTFGPDWQLPVAPVQQARLLMDAILKAVTQSKTGEIERSGNWALVSPLMRSALEKRRLKLSPSVFGQK